MDLTPVESKMLTGYGYDKDTQTLAVQFKQGGPVYHYAGVPQDVIAEFEKAESKGKFFLANIKPNYGAQKQEAPKPETVAV